MMWVKVDDDGQFRVPADPWPDLQSEGVRGFQGVNDVQVVCPGLSEILLRM